jgi:inositol polyphosphate-4-phosphatase
MLDSLADLVEAEAKTRAKLVDLLLVSCFLARAMNGARTTSCKSAKDRTSVFQTLEVARIAQRHQFLDR